MFGIVKLMANYLRYIFIIIIIIMIIFYIEIIISPDQINQSCAINVSLDVFLSYSETSTSCYRAWVLN